MLKYFKKLNIIFLIHLLLLLLVTNFGGACRSFKVSNKYNNDVGNNKNWILFGGEPHRINYREKTIAPPLEKAWTYKTSSAVGPTLIAANGVLYFATLDGRFEGISIETGKRIGKKSSEGHFEATCAFYEGNLIIASRYGNKTLANYNLETGKYLWKIDAGDIASEPLVTDNSIYISALYNHIDKYDFLSGEKIWSFKTTAQHRSSPALSNNILVVGCDNGTLYALNATNGVLKWEIKTGASITATPIIQNETIFIGSTDSNFYAVNLNDGIIQWQFNAKRPIYQTAATDGQDVLFGSSDGHFYCLNAETSIEKWRFRAKSVISTAPLLSGSVVYFGSLDRKYYCLNLKNGRELWNQETKGRIRTSPVVWKNYVLGASEDKYVYAFVQSDSVQIE